jgi:hypothetical protein
VIVISVIRSKYNEHLHSSVSYAYVYETNSATDAAKRAIVELVMVLLELAVLAVRPKWRSKLIGHVTTSLQARPETFWRREQAINLSSPLKLVFHYFSLFWLDTR